MKWPNQNQPLRFISTHLALAQLSVAGAPVESKARHHEVNAIMKNSPLWHPCTQMQHHDAMPVLSINKAKGAYLYLDNPLDQSGLAQSQPILDAISSWWVNLHGHSHPAINTAIQQQLEQFEHVILAGFSHQPIETLAQRLVDLTPAPLTRCFFADSGSAAVEVELKMSLQFWAQSTATPAHTAQSGQPRRNTFISLQNGYHGETLGSLSVTDIPLFSSQYRPLLIQHLKAPSPDLSLKTAEQSDDDYVKQCLNAMQQQLEQHQDQVCAVIIEPLVQGAAGMKMYPASYLTGLRQLCDQYHVHLILDEIAVGFGRTGTLFAHEQAGICPDFLCLSKGLTAGYLPMSCVMTTDEVYQAFYSPDVSKGFLHSHSFTGNPLAASAALASLDIFEREQTLLNNQQLAHTMQQQLQQLAQHPYIGNIRQTGMIAAFDVVQIKGQPYVPEPQRMRAISQLALKNGVLIRPI
ncbi:MAG: adenosylmethionine--8-amino-7-oxononanoate transaminase, partial [Moraxellaceae bacterium]